VLLVACLAIASLAFATACGSSSSSSSSSSGSSSVASGGTSDPMLAQAKQIVAQYSKYPTAIGPSQPIGKPVPKNKTIDYINNGATATLVGGNAFVQAADVLGWKVVKLFSQPTLQSVEDALDQAIRNRPDGVIISGFNADEFPHQLAQLQTLHIPIIGANAPPYGFTAVVPLATSVYAGLRLLSAKVVDDMNGSGTLGVVYLSGYPLPLSYTNAFVAEVKRLCPACKIVKITMAPTSLGTDAPTILTNFLRANPGMSHLMLSYDAEGIGLATAVKNASLALPKVYSYSPDAPGIQNLIDGTETAAIPQPYAEESWGWADALARIFTGESVAQSEKFPYWMIWAKDLGNLPKSVPAGGIVSVVSNYQQQFEKLWGVS
jgi:ribose transport system substrate-binding protein